MSRPVKSRQLQVTERIPASKATSNDQLSVKRRRFSPSEKFFVGREATTGKTSALRRLPTLRKFRNMLTALSSFVHGGESAETDVPAICPPPLPPSGPQNAVVPFCPSVAMQQSYLGRQQQNFLVENVVNLGAILPSESFQNCSFTFNVNTTSSHEFCSLTFHV